MKRITRLIMITAVILFGLISSKTTLVAAAESITEGTEWSGTVEGSKELSFVPAETGFYNVKLTDSKETCAIVSCFTENGSQVMDEIYTNKESTEINVVNALYLMKDTTYTIKILCADGIDYEQLMLGDVSLLITKSSYSAFSLAEYKKETIAFQNGYSICTYTPTESMIYSFYFELKTGESRHYVDLYSKKEDDSLTKLGTRNISDTNNYAQFQLEAGTEYYFIVSYYDFNNEDGSEVAAYSSIQKSNCITSIELNEAPILSTSDTSVFLITGSLKVNYKNDESNILDFYTDIDSSEIEAEYLGERDNSYHFKPGKQKVKFTYLDVFDVTSEIDVLTRSQYAEKVYGNLTAGQKISTNPDSWYHTQYKFTPSENGYYSLWYSTQNNLPLKELYNEWEYTIYDSQDNEVEWLPGKGFKLKANEDYCFELYLINNLTQYIFTYWLDINTDHTHTYSSWVTTKPATTTQTGIEERTCTDCGAIETRTINKVPTPIGNGNNTQTGSNGSAGSNTSVTPGTNANIQSSTPSKSILQKIILKSVKAGGKGKIVVKWKKSTAAKGYQLQYSTNKKFISKKTKTTNKTSMTIKKLKKKKTYYIRVRAYKIVNGKKSYGKWSSVKKIKMKK